MRKALVIFTVFTVAFVLANSAWANRIVLAELFSATW